ncbi:glyoxalase [Thermoplasmatales archaeon SW_10_69_26]|nr:MAG: glyoxalase [Thermoplasmatales archaeon SW_10_69_26]
MPSIGGIHHVTAVAGDPQENLDFYAGELGLRLVKRSVNQDDPTTYHLFYADREGRPGTDLTFFPFPDGRRGRTGAGIVGEVAFQVRPDSLDYWSDRLRGPDSEADVKQRGERFGDPVLTFSGPHGLDLAIVETEQATEREWTAWERSPVPEQHQLRGFHAVRARETSLEGTQTLVTDVLGMEHVGEDGSWHRYAGTDPASGYLELRAAPQAQRARGGRGTVHHVAWRAGDESDEKRLREAVADHGLNPTDVIDRFWFRSVYFREPGGVLFELATEEPGFTADEPLESLGERLVLPPWLEDDRDEIENVLADLELPYPTSQEA